MTEEGLKNALAAAAQRRAEERSRWDASFKDRAARAEDPEAPLTEAEDEALLDELARPFSAEWKKSCCDKVVAALAAADGAPRAEVVELGAHRRRNARSKMVIAGAAATLTALAAAAVIALRVAAPSTSPSLPAYSMAVAAGESSVRGPADGSSGPSVFGPGSVVDVTAKPDLAVSIPLKAKAFLIRRGDVIPISRPPQVASTGAVRLRAVVGRDFKAPPGEYRLAIAVGAAPTFPGDAELRALLVRSGIAPAEFGRWLVAEIRITD